MSTNPSKIPETPETLGKNEKSLGKNEKSLGNSGETLGKSSPESNFKVKTVGKVSELIPETTKKVVAESPETTKKVVAESPETTKKVVAESPETTKKVVAESPEKPKRKRNQSPRQLANLKKGTVKLDKVQTLEPEKVPEKLPVFNMNLPVKALIIMAFVVGATIGGFGLWKWWKENHKKKEIPQEIDYSQYVPEGTEVTQADLDAIQAYEESLKQ